MPNSHQGHNICFISASLVKSAGSQCHRKQNDTDLVTWGNVSHDHKSIQNVKSDSAKLSRLPLPASSHRFVWRSWGLCVQHAVLSSTKPRVKIALNSRTQQPHSVTGVSETTHTNMLAVTCLFCADNDNSLIRTRGIRQIVETQQLMKYCHYGQNCWRIKSHEDISKQ